MRRRSHDDREEDARTNDDSKTEGLVRDEAIEIRKIVRESADIKNFLREALKNLHQQLRITQTIDGARNSTIFGPIKDDQF